MSVAFFAFAASFAFCFSRALPPFAFASAYFFPIFAALLIPLRILSRFSLPSSFSFLLSFLLFLEEDFLLLDFLLDDFLLFDFFLSASVSISISVSASVLN